MDLTKLFKTQAVLDEHIMQEHPELRGQDNLDWKILALQVELAECANEWRGFKKWSKDQEPRIKVPVTAWGEPYKNPLLEEYVDCLHFILTIGLELGYTDFREEKMNEYLALVSEGERVDITGHFIAINYITSCIFENEIHYEQALFEILDLGERLGFTWEQIEEAYFAKNKVNHERQESGY